MTLSEFIDAVSARPPVRELRGLFSAHLAYPLAEHLEKRHIRNKVAELRRHYALPLSQRLDIAHRRCHAIVAYAGQQVPYYRDLFRRIGFDPDKLARDPAYLQDLPYLDKDTIRAEGERLLSDELKGAVRHERKTGGSTGLSCMIYYDPQGLDYTAAVVLFARGSIGKSRRRSELHFACRFPDAVPERWPSREDLKCLAMNRSNIFFDRLDAVGLEEMWQLLRLRRPYLIHGHPSTLHALACHVEARYGRGHAFEVFESSGELLHPHQRDKIAAVLGCRVVDRYGLAELGVVAYELGAAGEGLQVLDSEAWPESMPTPGEDAEELVFTGFRNRLMPLIRYRTGDLARVERTDRGLFLRDVVGRMHDMVPISGIPHPTHHVMDMLDHRVGSIQEFQIDIRSTPPTLRIVPEAGASTEHIRQRIEQFWPQGFRIEFVTAEDFVRVGRHQKFRHLVHP